MNVGLCRAKYKALAPTLTERIWVMARGMMSADNLGWLRETGRRYLVGAPKVS